LVTQQPIFFRSNNSSDATATEYNYIHGRNSTWITTRTSRECVIPTAGKFKELNIKIDTAPGGSTVWTFTLFVNGVASTALTGTISASGTTLTVTSDQAISQQDLVSLEVKATTGTPTNFTRIDGNLIWEPTIDDEYIILGTTNDNALAANATEYNFIETSVQSWNGGDDNRRPMMPASGTMKNLAVTLSATPGGSDSYTFTLRKDASGDTSLTTICNDTDFSTIDTTNTPSVTAGDLLKIKVVGTATAATPFAMWGVVFVPTTSGEIPAIGGTQNNLDNSITEFNLFGQAAGMTATESDRDIELVNIGITVIAQYVEVSTAPGAGDSFIFDVNKNGTPETGVRVTISESNTTGNNTGATIVFVATDKINLQVDPTGTPASSSDPYYGFVFTFGAAPAANTKRSFIPIVIS